MESQTLLLVLQYDGAGFAGWQRQPDTRTVQGVIEDAMERLCGSHVSVSGAGRTDAGVHALGQAASLRVPAKWGPAEMMRALNAVLARDVRVTACKPMRAEFHARYSAVSRSYRYLVGTDADAESPFRSGLELAWKRPLDRSLLQETSSLIVGNHSFRGFAVKGTAPEGDDHRCIVQCAVWKEREAGLQFDIRANRFLHHMVRFLVGTMLDIASGRREIGVMRRLLDAQDNSEVSPPAPPHGLFLDSVEYPSELYLVTA